MVANGPTLEPWIARIYQAPVSPASRAEPASATPAAFVARVDRGRDGLFRITGLANQRPIHFVVDTGATVTVLTSRDAAALNLPAGRPDGGATLRTAGGAAPMAWNTIDRLEVGGSHLRHLDVVMVRSGLDHSLLGQDVLSRLGTITMTRDRLEIRRAPA